MTHLQVTTTDRVTTIRLDRPDKKNAITLDMYAELRACARSGGERWRGARDRDHRRA